MNGRGRLGRSVLFLSSTTAGLGGAELYVTTLAQQLARTGYPSTVACPRDGPFAMWLRQQAVPTLIAPIPERLVSAARASFGPTRATAAGLFADTLRAQARIYRLVSRQEPAIVHLNTFKAALYGAVGARLAGARVIWDFKDLLSHPSFGRVLRALVVATVNGPVERVIANSAAIRDDLVRYGADRRKIVVLYNGVDLARLAPTVQPAIARSQLRIAEAPTVGMFTRLAPWKGVEVFIDAIAAVRSSHPRTRFLVVGDVSGFDPPAYRDELEQRASALGLSDVLQFLGFRDDVPLLMAACDVVVHASTLPEPLGLTPIEAMAAGRPVVAARAGGCLETIEEGVTGLLTTPGDAMALAAALGRLIGDGELRRRMGRAGRERAERLFDLRDNARRVAELYDRLLEV